MVTGGRRGFYRSYPKIKGAIIENPDKIRKIKDELHGTRGDVMSYQVRCPECGVTGDFVGYPLDDNTFMCVSCFDTKIEAYSITVDNGSSPLILQDLDDLVEILKNSPSDSGDTYTICKSRIARGELLSLPEHEGF